MAAAAHDYYSSHFEEKLAKGKSEAREVLPEYAKSSPSPAETKNLQVRPVAGCQQRAPTQAREGTRHEPATITRGGGLLILLRATTALACRAGTIVGADRRDLERGVCGLPKGLLHHPKTIDRARSFNAAG